MRSLTTKSTALMLYRPLSLQVALPLCGALTLPTLDQRARADIVAALARLLLEAAGAPGGAEADDDAS